MQTLHIDEDDAVATTVAALRAGAVVVVPTDTVYGLAAAPDRPEAVAGIYQAKGRPEQMHLPVLAASLDQVRQLGTAWSPGAAALADRWWPGPLTLVFGFAAAAERPAWLADRQEVAVRIPDHAFLLAVMAQTGVLLVTSANQHGQATAPDADQAAHLLAPHVSLIVDGGTLATTPSTLVNVRPAAPTIEREGAIDAATITTTLASVA
jgi:L-threonylcarbamoyladenylate synthase